MLGVKNKLLRKLFVKASFCTTDTPHWEKFIILSDPKSNVK